MVKKTEEKGLGHLYMIALMIFKISKSRFLSAKYKPLCAESKGAGEQAFKLYEVFRLRVS